MSSLTLWVWKVVMRILKSQGLPLKAVWSCTSWVNLACEYLFYRRIHLRYWSRYSSDHRLNDFPGYDHPDWDIKREHAKEAKEAAGETMKVISVYTSLFLEDSFGVSFLSSLWLVCSGAYMALCSLGVSRKLTYFRRNSLTEKMVMQLDTIFTTV